MRQRLVFKRVLTKETVPVQFRTMGGPAPDPKWTYVDKMGHTHRYGEGPEPWPTLKWVVDREVWCEDCHENHDEGHWECDRCGEQIEPGQITKGPEMITKPGPTTWLIDGIPVTEEEWEAAYKEEMDAQPPEPETRYVTVTAHCPWGHRLELSAEMREEGPDGEVVALLVDSKEVACPKCGSRLGDTKED